MKIAESRQPDGPGILALQHEKYQAGKWSLDMRTSLLASRIVDRQGDPSDDASEGMGHYVYDPDSIGDIHGGFLFKKNSREIPGWRFAWPVIVSPPNGSPGSRRPGATNEMLPVINRVGDAKNYLTPDDRFLSEPYDLPTRDGKPIWPALPMGFFGIGLTAQNEDVQYPMFLPTDPRIPCPDFAGAQNTSALVCDEQADTSLDPNRSAPINGFFRVVKNPSASTISFRLNASALAWRLSPGALGGAGYGMVWDRPAPDTAGGSSGSIAQNNVQNATNNLTPPVTQYPPSPGFTPVPVASGEQAAAGPSVLSYTLSSPGTETGTQVG